MHQAQIEILLTIAILGGSLSAAAVVAFRFLRGELFPGNKSEQRALVDALERSSAEIEELHERMDFLERLVVDQRLERGEPVNTPTPS
ncbi:MAG: hypothetical protein OEZ54_07575 [Gemmatimonadota bacterium]|nr:hypothetical protein [Gemmatimonadota bacterium]